MVSEVLVHVGMHKTGTTALQRAMSGYDDGTTRHARLGQENHSVPFVTLYSSTPHRYHIWQAIGAAPDFVAQARARYRAMLDAELALPRRLTVIGEEISLLPPAAITAMSADLTAQGRRLSLLAYLRDPLGYVASAFQQQVRGGQACFTLPRPHYRGRFAKFLALPGTVTLAFRAFTPQRFVANSVVADFSNALGLPPAALADCRDVNPAMPLDALRLVHLLNRTAPPIRSQTGQAARSALIRHLSASFSGRFTLPADIAACVIDPDEVAWIEDVSHISLGPRIAPTDPARAQTALAALLAAIPPGAIDRLRADLSLRGQPLTRQDDAAGLILRLFQTFLDVEQERSTTPRSATA